MDAILTIDGDAYDDASRAASRIKQLSLTVSLDDYDELSFVEDGCGPIPTFKECMPAELTIDGEVRFRGEISKISRKASPGGWEFAYSTYGLARLADFVPVRSRDGSSEFCANMPPTVGDPSYSPSLAGLTVGDIVKKVLTVPATAAALDAYGVGDFDMAIPATPVLPAETLADLATLDVVPPQGVVLSGHGIVNQLRDFIGQWHRSRYLYIRPDDGVIRVFNVTEPESTRAIQVPGDTDFEDADPVDWPAYDRDVQNCYSRVEIIGRDIQVVALSTKDETLTAVQGTDAAWTTAQEAAWRITSFTQPADARDEGTLSSLTTTSCSVSSLVTTKTWAANYWNGQQAQIYFYNDAVTGVEVSESRPITTCTSKSSGGSATIGWDASMPLSSVGYNRYRIVGRSGALSMVGRKFLVKNPSDDTTGLNTFIGAHLVTAFPRPVAWAVGPSVTNYATPTAAVFWSIDGSATGYNELTIPIVVDPEIGGIIASIPVVQVSAPPSQLMQGYPTTFAQGKPTDFVALVAYNRGELAATSPNEPIATVPTPTGYSGDAFDQLGLKRTLTIPVESWTWIGDKPAMRKLAEAVHESVRDPIDEGSIYHHGVPSWDFLTLGYGLQLSLSGGTASPWDDLTLMVRSVTLSWPNDGPDIHAVEIKFGNRCRAFEGQSLYVHPAYGGGGFDGGFGDDGDFMMLGGVASPDAMLVQPFPQATGMGGFDDGTSAAIQSHLGGIGDQLAAFQDMMVGGPDFVPPMPASRPLSTPTPPPVPPVPPPTTRPSEMEVPRTIPGGMSGALDRLGQGLAGREVSPATPPAPTPPPAPPAPAAPLPYREERTATSDWTDRLRFDDETGG